MPIRTKQIVGIADADRERFMRYVSKQANGCWLWTAHCQPDGRGRFGIASDWKLMAYRFAYAAFVGPIPDGLTIDHLCCVPTCVNPAHLEAVTTQVNTRRSPHTLVSKSAAKTQCKRGHPLDGIQISRGRPTRYCLTCSRIGPRGRRAIDGAA